MASSTSSSDFVLWFRDVGGEVWRPALIAGLLVVGALGLYRVDPTIPPVPIGRGFLELMFLSTQMDRAAELPASDVLIVGDSSSLMGLDAAALSQRSGKNVQSLAVMAPVGPVGYAAIARRYLERAGPVRRLIIQLSPATFDMRDAEFASLGFEQMALDGQITRALPWWEGARTKLYATMIDQVMPLPLRGAYGASYGWPADVREYIWSGHGTMYDPTASRPLDFRPIEGEYTVLSGAMARRLSEMGQIVRQLPVGSVKLLITPMRKAPFTPSSRMIRDTMVAEVMRLLGLPPDALLDLPATLPDELFVSSRHLNQKGRAMLTDLLLAQMDLP